LKTKLPIWLWLSIPILGFVLFLLWPSGGNREHTFFYSSSDWNTKYDWESKAPRGLYLFSKVIRHAHPKSSFFSIDSPAQFDSLCLSKKPVNIIAVGDTLALTPRERKKLGDLLEKGSHLFFSAQRAKLLGDVDENEFVIQAFYYQKGATFHFNGQKAKFHHLEGGDTVANAWYGLEIPQPNPYPELVLVRNKNLAVYSKSQWYEGGVFIHAAPHTLCNYNLINDKGFEYANFVISQLPKNRPVYFLNISRISGLIGEMEETPEEAAPGLLDLIMKNPLWRNGLLLTLLGVFLFAFFRSKRRRAIIYEPKKKVNTTKAYVDTISSIYLGKQNPANLLRLQKQNFFQAVNRHFYMDLSRDDHPDIWRKLAEKSDYPLEKLELFRSHIKVENVELDYTYVLKVAEMQDAFYRHCGIKKSNKERLAKQSFVIYPSVVTTFILTLLSLYLFFQGLYSLTQANGFGVFIWILGLIGLVFSFRRFVRPFVGIADGYFTIYGWLKKESFPLEEVTYIKEEKTWKIKGKIWKPAFWEVDQNALIRLLNYYLEQHHDN